MVTHIISVESQWVRCAFGATPEWLSCAGNTVFRQTEEKLLNVVVEFLLKLESRPYNALLEGQGLICD